MGAKESHFGKNAIPKIQMKTIFLPDSFQWWGKSSWENPHVLNEEDCPGLQQKCAISQIPDSDLVMDALITVRDTLHTRYFNVSSHILKFYFMLEPPFISEATLESSNELLASFYRGSDVNTPYGKWVYYDPSVKFKTQERNFSAGKTKMAAIFTSNCGTWNHRMDFIWELQKYVSVDVYGACGQLSCALYRQKECYAMLKRDYHFYLSFENSNCRDYVTEKLFVNAYENDVIPVVLGAHPEDYKAICQEKSYIHVEDFEITAKLTNYIKTLGCNS
ncbi:Glycoprotein 3-alpha-L-fucosyltransferase A [Orchesella cincta]|uniref:Fucosyltransferase n=1 Tax=Orchesella cincta TaxID=48709 RepID=A0A1D2M7C3_ORCCI|nr:Glycoprotein 3-alpha-L-fucosyltransferase A [Orchesella cincta]